MRISKMLAALLICVALVGANNTSQATKISGSKVSKVVEHVCFDTNQSVETEGKNGLKVIFTGIEARNYHLRVGAERSADSYWFIKPYIGDDYRIGVAGLKVTFENTTDHILVIKWSQSVLAMGDFNGYPAFPGMNLSNAGVSNGVVDTIIPPKSSVKLVPLVSRVTRIKGEYCGDYERLRSDGSLKAILSLKVVDQDGKESYTIAQSPNIILPPSALTELGVKIKGR